ncbi:MAG: hypothetical protein MUF31_07310 [Akkermansiaceae bacterium]|jgi:hypothetical protein|nr:hypothetical protein [Akkermansiaceae bacterium]
MPPSLRWLLALSCAAHAAPGTSLLTLTPPNLTTGVNAITITVQPGTNAGLADTKKARLAGTILADIEVDIAQDDPIEMTLRQGRGTAKGETTDNLVFAKSLPFFGSSYNVTFSNLSFAIDTPNPPGIISDPVTGTFDSSQFRFLVDQGTATGNYQVLFGALTPINETFTPADPLGGPGEGDGTLALVRTGTRPGFIDYSVTLEFPVDIDQLQGEGTQQVRIQAEGYIRATGTLSVSSSGYLQWTLEEGIRGAPRDGDYNEDGISNILSWGLGLDAIEDARPHLPQVLGNRSYRLPLPIGGSGAPLRLMVSSNLSQWTPVPTTRISTGQNPLPAGATGNITVSPAAATREYFRLEVIE